MPAPILPAAEPLSAEGGPIGAVVLHGYTGNPHSMRLLAEAFAADGHSVELPLLPGLVDPPAASFREMLRGMVEAGATSLPSIGSDIAMAGAVEFAYSATPIEPLLSLFDAVDGIAAELGEVRWPVLLFSSRSDRVVPSQSGDLLVERAGGPVERVWLERSFHVATLDDDAPVIRARALGFMSGATAER